MIYFDFSDFVIEHTDKKDFHGLRNARMTAYFSQQGLCYVTGKPLQKGHRELHHRKPRFYGGEDTVANTVLLDKSVHRLIHTANPREIKALLAEIKPTSEQLERIDQLRREAHMPALPQAGTRSSMS